MEKIGLERFHQAHQQKFELALKEVQSGMKQSHWMWYIFPQIKGLGFSATSQYYAIADVTEARQFLEDAYLGGNLRRICAELMKSKTDNPEIIFGYVDALKLHSSMTLFDLVGGYVQENEIFKEVLKKFFNGAHDPNTVKIVEEMNK